MAENMFEIGSMVSSHVLFESEAYGNFSEALSAEVQPVLSNYRPILASTFARSSPFSIFSHFPWFYLRHLVVSFLPVF